MPNASQLPFLIKLVDDPSPTVWAKVAGQLREFGPGLWREIEEQNITLTSAQRSILEEIVQVVDADVFRKTWLDWLELDGESEQLESALARLAAWQLGQMQPVRASRLTELLDDLAAEFRAAGYPVDPENLSRFLFSDKGLRGVDAARYYDPLNSNLIHVIESGSGIPISLAAIFMLVGQRLNLDIYGCNFPGHFLARAHIDGQDLFFDCFNEGRLLSDEETQALRKAAPGEASTATSAAMIVARVLGNLANAYYQAGDNANIHFVLSLLQDLEYAAST